jgi:hypothetical protein
MREAAFYGQARTYYELMSDAERPQIRARVARLEQDPSADGAITLAIPDFPRLFLYDDGVGRMTYNVPDDATLVVRSIAHVLDLPD